MGVVHCKRESYDVYIGRPSKWGNPFTAGTREENIADFERYLLDKPELLQAVGELKGKTLGCWCAPKPCHGNVLERYANESKGT
jgi:hypothetical protein